jgi:hypothetical protein
MTNFEEITDNIKNVIEEQTSKELRIDVNLVLNLAVKSYIKVKFPETKNYVHEEWFEEEAILSGENGEEASFFIPLKRVFEKHID